MVVVCFDISDPKRLRKVAGEMGNFGVRVQKSVFECHIDTAGVQKLQKRLARVIVEEEDKVRYYPLCPKDAGAICIDGRGSVTRDSDYFTV